MHLKEREKPRHRWTRMHTDIEMRSTYPNYHGTTGVNKVK
jgi:hypothetical protein